MNFAQKIVNLAAEISAAFKSDRSRLAIIENRTSSFGSANVTINGLLVNSTQDVTVQFARAMPDTNYSYTDPPLVTNLLGLNLSSLNFSFKSKTVNSITFTVKNAGLAVLSGSFILSVFVQEKQN